MRPEPAAGELSRRRRNLVLAICCASIVVVVMDISIVNVALPAIRRDLHASVSGPRRVDPLLELRLFRSAPFSAAILMALLPCAGSARSCS